ncbi:hypothetical protein [Comamonas granuli]|uniref:hypothetical protein n=1 Tax=Comamonas granuli TaxID=290309 RepID=UPI0005A64B47|nr:hypothetical protein [Comamonas granuli]
MTTSGEPAGPGRQERKQQVRARIAAQRERLQARAQERQQARAQAQDAAAAMAAVPLPQRVVAFAKEHPLALALLAAGVALAGPARLVRWAGVALPWLIKLRGR